MRSLKQKFQNNLEKSINHWKNKYGSLDTYNSKYILIYLIENNYDFIALTNLIYVDAYLIPCYIVGWKNINNTAWTFNMDRPWDYNFFQGESMIKYWNINALF